MPRVRHLGGFADALKGKFGEPNKKMRVQNRLPVLKQRDGQSADDYPAEFELFVVNAQFDDEALLNIFRSGLGSGCCDPITRAVTDFFRPSSSSNRHAKTYIAHGG